jgi:hypothetical protein
MINTELLTIEVSFDTPNWFPPDRLDYSRTIYYPKGHAYAGSYDCTVYHNSAEDNILNRFKDITETYKYYWIKFEYHGSPEKLSQWIKNTQNRLNKFFNQYKEAKEELN